MAEPFLSEIRLMAFNFPPKGWALCNGQLLPINQNQALFALLGTTFGGDGRVNFALPNLQGKVPIHVAPGSYPLGSTAGEYAHTLTPGELPQHTHMVVGDTVAGTANPTPTSRLANSQGAQAWGPPNNVVAMDPASVSNVGGSQAHENTQPYLVISMCIALQGIFPSPN